MTDHVVRPARPDEFAAVGALTADAYRVDGLLTRSAGTAHYEAELLDAAGRAAAAELVAVEPGGRLLGTVTWCPPGSRPARGWPPAPTRAEFRMLAVTPAARRRGVARALVEPIVWPRRSRQGLAELVLSSGCRRSPPRTPSTPRWAATGLPSWTGGSGAAGCSLWGFRLPLRPGASGAPDPATGDRRDDVPPRSSVRGLPLPHEDDIKPDNVIKDLHRSPARGPGRASAMNTGGTMFTEDVSPPVRQPRPWFSHPVSVRPWPLRPSPTACRSLPFCGQPTKHLHGAGDRVKVRAATTTAGGPHR